MQSDLSDIPRKIEQLEVRSWTGISTAWTTTYSHCKIYLSHTTSSSLSTTFANNYGSDRTLVFSRTSYTISNPGTATLIPFTLDSKFDYDGTSNLVWEISWTSGSYTGYFYGGVMEYGYDSNVHNIYGYGGTATTGNLRSSAGLVTKIVYEKVTPPSTDKTPFTHIYRDDPAVGDEYTLTIHLYDDDLGHGEYSFAVRVNNVDPTIDPRYVMPTVVGWESGSPSVLLPQVPFDDPATQYDLNDPNEVWTYWWDLDNNGLMNNAPDVIGTVDQSDVREINDHSYGTTPAVKATVNDDYMQKPIALYIFDDDMTHSPSANPSSTAGTMTVNNVAPVASIETYIPMEVRVRMSGTQENDLRVQVKQTHPKDPRDVLMDEMIIERMPGQPKENPFSDGSPSAPLMVKVEPWRIIELVVTYDATADSNDVHTTSGPNGADPVWLYLDFPQEDDYDPAEDSQSSSKGHHWAQEIKWNVQQDGAIATETIDVSSEMYGKKAYLIGISNDDASDDAQFNWGGTGAPLAYTQITYYNDGSDPQVGGPFTDLYPSPWDGTAPVTYMDVHEYTYTTGFTVSLTVSDDDGGTSNTATLTVY
jgi:hypothetical protein